MAKQTGKFRTGMRQLGELTPAALSPAAAKLGFGESDIILHWPDIAGARLSEVSEPERLQWPVRPTNALPGSQPEPAVLFVRVEGAFAIEVQHLAPVLMDRINARLGWRCIGRIAIRQGPVRHRPRGRGKVPPPPNDKLREAEQLTTGIETETLRGALNRLGARVLSEPKPAAQLAPRNESGYTEK